MNSHAKSILMCGILLGTSIQLVNAAQYDYKKGKSSIYIAAGKTDVKANEIVYCQPSGGCPSDFKLSHLIWESTDVPMLTTGFSYNTKDVRLTIEGQFVVTDGDGVMDDYDWLDVPNLDWSDWSHHDDTSLEKATTLDINLDFNIFGKDDSKLSFLVGYRDSSWQWESRGGNYVYSSSGTLRDLTGSFTAGQPVISYEQSYTMPYIGFKYDLLFDKLNLNLQFDYSNQVKVGATDHHFLRDLTFNDEFANGEMIAYKIGVGYQFTDSFNGFVRYDVQDYDEVRGDTIYVQTSTGIAFAKCLNCAGADNKNETLSVGLSYSY